MRNNQRLLVLLTGTMVIAAAVYGALVISQHRAQRATDAGISLALGDQEAIERIFYRYEGEEIALEKGESGWVLATDPKLNIDQKLPRQMCEFLGTLKATREISGGGRSREFGLASPQTVIDVTADGMAHSLSVGLRNSNTQEYYVSVDGGDAAFLVDESVFNGFQYGKEELYLPPEPVSLYYTYAAEFSYMEEPGTLTEFVKQDSVWRRKDDPSDAVDQDALFALMKQFCTIKVQRSITAPGPEDYGLKAPAQTITLRNDAQSVTIFFGTVDENTGQQYIRVTGSDRVYEDCVYTVDAAVLQEFQTAAETL